MSMFRQRPSDEFLEDELLPTIALVYVPHESVPNFYQRCYEYVEPWQWSSEAERIETGIWVFAPSIEALEPPGVLR